MAINTKSQRHRMLAEKRKPVRDVYKGTKHMREQGALYLPKEPGETDEMYKARKDRTFLLNAVESAVLGVRSKVFSEDIIVENDSGRIPQENVDMQGTKLSSFMSEVFFDGVLDGLSFILVDSPSMDGVATLADQQRRNVRPFFNKVTMDQVLGWSFTVINNVPVLSGIRIHEEDVRTDSDFEETVYERVRHYYLVWNEEGTAYTINVEIQEREKGDSDDSWVVVEGFPKALTGISRIPLVPFYTNKTGDLEAEPFFSSLTQTNLQHWQKKSDHDWILHIVSVPRFYAYGFAEGEADTIKKHGSASVIVSSKRPDEVEAGWIVASVDTLEETRIDIENLEKKMDAQALDPLVTEATQMITATRTKTDAAKSNSVIQFWARSFADAVTEAYTVADEFAGVATPSDFTAVVNDDYEIVEDAATVGKELREWHGASLISGKTARSQGKELGLLPTDLDEDKEKELIASEMLDMMPAMPVVDDNAELEEETDA